MGRATAEFYGAAAQIFPLLYLALAIESRGGPFVAVDAMLERADVGASLVRAIYAVVATVILGFGEVAALIGLSHPTFDGSFAAGHTGWIVAFALASGGVLLAVPPLVLVLFTLVERLAVKEDDVTTRRVLLGFSLMMALVIISFVAYLGYALLH